jgi:PKD repeat protein
MQKLLSISVCCILIFWASYSFAQKKVIHITELNTEIPLQFLPDVEGYVLVDQEILNPTDFKLNPDPIEVYPNWPINQNGASNRGGIYCNLDDDPDLEIVYNIGQKVYAWKIDGSLVPGWPVTVTLFPDGAPAFGDIDGDGEGEIVVSCRNPGTGNNGSLSAFEKDGTLISGFPVTLTGGATKTPVLADLNGDNVMEIIIEERSYPDGYVGVYYGDGTTYPGFPVMLDYIPGSAVAVGDITGDNIPEIVAESYYSIIAYDNEGNLVPGFPFTPGNQRVFSYSTPVLADLDNDGKREIIAGDHSLTGNGAIHVLRYDGTVFPGWPKYTSYWIYGPPAVGDIDGDGNLDIAVGDQVLSGTPSDRVYVWDKDGNPLAGWPTSPMNAINNQILLVDLDGDGQIELMWDENTGNGNYIGYNHDGTPMDGWPLEVMESSFFMNPFATDINNDGILDLSGAGINISTGSGYYYLWNVNETYDENLAILPVLQYNVRHDGVYRDANVLNADFFASQIDICEGETVQFTDQSSGSIESWEWTFQGGEPETSTEQNPEVLYENSGEYDVSLTVSDGTNIHTTTKTAYIKVDYEVVVPDQPDGPTDIVTSQSPYTFYETNSENAEAYIWELIPDTVGVLIETDTINQIKIYWSQANSYSAELRVKGENACGESEFSEPLVIYVNWNTGVTSNKETVIEIYPNPSKGNLFVNLNEISGQTEIQILNPKGEILEKKSLIISDSKALEFDLSDLPDGIYLLRINSNEKNIVKKLLLIR